MSFVSIDFIIFCFEYMNFSNHCIPTPVYHQMRFFQVRKCTYIEQFTIYAYLTSPVNHNQVYVIPHCGAILNGKYKSSVLIRLSVLNNACSQSCVLYEHNFILNMVTKRNLSKTKSTFSIWVFIRHNAMQIL